MGAPRNYQPSPDKYRYGMNTQEKDNEIFEGAYTAEFWEYDSRTGKRWNTDPIVEESESPYATNRNNPIANSDPNGDCPDCPKPSFNFGVKATFNLGRNGGMNVSAFGGASLKTGFLTTGLNASATFYAGGVGTSKYSKTLFTGNLSPSLTFGVGSGSSRPLNTFNAYSGTGVFTGYKNSVSFGQNFILSSGRTSEKGYNRNQRNSYFGITAGDAFSFGHYNDVKRFPFMGDGKDEFWSAGLNASIDIKGYNFGWTNDMYYGKSNEKATYAQDNTYGGVNTDAQMAYDGRLNNAQETFNITTPTSLLGGTQVQLGFGRSGKKAMWPSNHMHNTIPDPNDPSKHFHYLFVPNSTKSSFRIGLQYGVTK